MFTKHYSLHTPLQSEEARKKLGQHLDANNKEELLINWKELNTSRPYSYTGSIDNFLFTIRPAGYRYAPLLITGEIQKEVINLTIKPTAFFYGCMSVLLFILVSAGILLGNMLLSGKGAAILPIGMCLFAFCFPLMAYYKERSRSKTFLFALFQAKEIPLA